MYKRTVTYTDYNGNERTEDFYFNLTEAELTELNFSYDGGMKGFLESIVESNNANEIVQTFKKIVKLAYGVKSEDGRRFVKSKELSEEFTQTPVYNQLFMEFATDAKSAAEFVNGVIPKIKDSSDRVENGIQNAVDNRS